MAHAGTPLTFALPSREAIIDLLTTTSARCERLQLCAECGDEAQVDRLIHQHTNMVHGEVHAADLARDAGHISLSLRMRELWSQVERLGGYARYNARQAERGRWMILRDRIAASQPTERFGAISELTEIFGSVKLSDNEA